MKPYKGVIIEESLKTKDLLKQTTITSTQVELVTEKHQTPHLKQWTLHSIEVAPETADDFADQLSKALIGDKETGSWYADYKNAETVYIIFPNKVFKISRTDEKAFQEARNYGISLGIPEHQVDFSPSW